ncbi:response regulator, partial [Dissulfuribacter thermophilus]|uniref:response regulator n=1 Tax=Dissulfuribacter thermophilus TaxID=1156395 RepID=UPI00114617A6
MKRCILLIEDELSMRLGITHALSGAGYEITACEDGKQGVKALGQRRFDLVITDLRLPGLNGMEVLSKAKEMYPDIGVIIITAFPEIETAVSAIKQGAFDYISKPFTNEALLIVIERG